MASGRLTLSELAARIRAGLPGAGEETGGPGAHLAEFDDLASGLVDLLLDGEGPEPPTARGLWHLLHDRLADGVLAQLAVTETPDAAAAFAARLSAFCAHLAGLRESAGPGFGWAEIFPGRAVEVIRLSVPGGGSLDLAVPLHRIRRSPDGALTVAAIRLADGAADLPGCVELAILWKLAAGALPGAPVCAVIEFYLPERKEEAVKLADLEGIFERFAVPAIQEAAGSAQEPPGPADDAGGRGEPEEEAAHTSSAPLNGARRVVGPGGGPAGPDTARQLKTALELQGLAGEVASSAPGPQVTRYVIRPGPRETAARYKASAEALQEAFQLVHPPLIFEDERLVFIDLPRRMPRAVTLHSLLSQEGAPEPGHPLAFYLGVEAGNLPLVADLGAAGCAHIVAGGGPGSGKSQFLRSVAACLARCNPPGSVSFSLIDLGGGGFECLSEPALHLAGAVVRDAEEAMEILAGAASAIGERRELLASEGIGTIRERWRQGLFDLRHEIVIIDETLPLAARPSPFAKEFERLALAIISEGREVGIHLLMATRASEARGFPKSVLSAAPLRLVFQTASAAASKFLAGFEGAERLLGRGDFLFARNGLPCRAQAPVIDDARLVEILSKADALFEAL